VQQWHGARDISAGNIRPGTTLRKKSGKDEQRRIDCGKARNAKMAYGTEA
jgi:hypothetical protein